MISSKFIFFFLFSSFLLFFVFLFFGIQIYAIMTNPEKILTSFSPLLRIDSQNSIIFETILDQFIVIYMQWCSFTYNYDNSTVIIFCWLHVHVHLYIRTYRRGSGIRIQAYARMFMYTYMHDVTDYFFTFILYIVYTFLWYIYIIYMYIYVYIYMYIHITISLKHMYALYIYLYMYVCMYIWCVCVCVCVCVSVSSIFFLHYRLCLHHTSYKSMEYSFFFFIYIYKDFFRKGEGEKNYLKTYQNHAFICVYTHVSYLSRKRYAIFRNINIHSLIPCTSGVGDRAKSPSRTDEKNLGRDLLLFSQSYF